MYDDSESSDVADYDGDGLFDEEEATYGTDPGLPDSDFDGLTDYEEIYGVEVYQVWVDTWSDPAETSYIWWANSYTTYNLDPLNPDTDWDGLPDGFERTYGTDPADGNDAQFPAPGGQPFLLEYWDGTAYPFDADGDGYPDAAEISGASNPHDPNSAPASSTESEESEPEEPSPEDSPTTDPDSSNPSSGSDGGSSGSSTNADTATDSSGATEGSGGMDASAGNGTGGDTPGDGDDTSEEEEEEAEGSKGYRFEVRTNGFEWGIKKQSYEVEDGGSGETQEQSSSGEIDDIGDVLPTTWIEDTELIANSATASAGWSVVSDDTAARKWITARYSPVGEWMESNAVSWSASASAERIPSSEQIEALDDGGYLQIGSAELIELRLVLDEPAKGQDFVKQFVHVTEVANLDTYAPEGSAPDPVIQVLKLRVPVGETESAQTIRLAPAGGSPSVDEDWTESLLPVEVLVPKEDSTSSGFSSDLISTTELKVAKWEDAFEGTAENPSVKQDLNEGDVDRFYLKVTMPWNEGQGTATVKIKTDSDPENEIEVVEIPGEPGVFRTNGLILVSNETDDLHPQNTDEQLTDVTHKVKLGDTVTFTVETPAGGSATIEATVKKRGTLKLKTWRFQGANTRNASQVERAVEIMKEIFAQIGLDVAHTPAQGQVAFNFEVQPARLKLFEYDAQNLEVRFLEEGKNLMEQFSTPGTVDAYFIETMVGGSAATMGQAMTDAFVTTLPGETDIIGNLLKYTDKVFIKDLLIADHLLGFGGYDGVEHVLAHEVLHLPGSIEHEPETYNLMHKKLVEWSDSVTDQRRISQAQEDTVFGLNFTYIELEE